MSFLAQSRYAAEQYLRQRDQWLFSEASNLTDIVHLHSIECDLVLTDIYDKVTIPNSVEHETG